MADSNGAGNGNDNDNLKDDQPPTPELGEAVGLPPTIPRRSLVARLFGLAWEYRGRCLAALGTAVFVQLLALGGFIFSGLALDILRHAQSPEKAPTPTWPFGLSNLADFSNWTLQSQIMLAAGIVLGLTLIRSGAYYLSRIADEGLVQAVVVRLRTRLYHKLQHQTFAFYDEFETGGLINRVTGDAQSVRQFVQGIVVRVLVSGCTLALFLTYMLKAHWGLTVAVLVVVPLQGLAMWQYARRVRPRFKAMREAIDRLIQTLQESVIGVKVVKGFGREPEMVARFAGRNTDANNARLSIAKLMSSFMPSIPFFGFLQLAILLGYGGFLVRLGPEAGGIALGTLWVFLSLIRRLAEQVDAMIQVAAVLPEAMTGAERVFEIIDADPTIAPPAATAYTPAPETVRGAITLENVSFKFPSAESQDAGQWVLENVSLDIEPGETVAVVGPAGAGKTSLLNLMPRFYDPQVGRVLIDGVDARDWDLDALRRAFGIVFQEPYLFSNSVMANIAFGRDDSPPEVVEQALNDACADEFVNDLPKGLKTIVGERGLTLSGGERQRLSLARALLVEPPIMLLDDATSSVDARTEVRIQKALNRIMMGRTTLIVAHRLSTLRRADRIVVLERGRVAGVGTHDQLLESNEHYRRSAELQLERELAEWRQGRQPDAAAEAESKPSSSYSEGAGT
ncbi:MAG: ABC transporter ATP-binding protein [Planctomycetes bacterium]|nr:ABC transporter ATP-binding protein [Planctomycetota bacterium]NOG55064.1 ABC transporter ATP-binding protein [Planctomycetota bacterium]